MPQRPEVSPKQATPLPLPDRLRQPLNYTNSTFPQYIQAVAPIYIERVGLIYITIPDGGLPAVILNLVRDDLRMMAPKPVVARAGGMKDIADNCDYYP